MAKRDEKTCFLIDYRDPKDGSSVSIKARNVKDSSLGVSFVALSDFIFDTHSVLVNPEEESKKLKFENIETLHLSIYSIMSIAEIGENNKGLEFKNDKSNLLVLKTDQPGAPTN